MSFLSCIVNEIGPAADGTETSDPVIYVNLTDTQGSFTGQWFYAAEGSQGQFVTIAPSEHLVVVRRGFDGLGPGEKQFDMDKFTADVIAAVRSKQGV